MEAELKDVGDQALMRGLVTAFSIMRLGLFLSYFGRRSLPVTNGLTDIPLPWSRLRPWARMYRRLRRRDQAARLRRDSHMKPASSRAIAVQITVVRLPRAASFR